MTSRFGGAVGRLARVAAHARLEHYTVTPTASHAAAALWERPDVWALERVNRDTVARLIPKMGKRDELPRGQRVVVRHKHHPERERSGHVCEALTKRQA